MLCVIVSGGTARLLDELWIIVGYAGSIDSAHDEQIVGYSIPLLNA